MGDVSAGLEDGEDCDWLTNTVHMPARRGRDVPKILFYCADYFLSYSSAFFCSAPSYLFAASAAANQPPMAAPPPPRAPRRAGSSSDSADLQSFGGGPDRSPPRSFHQQLGIAAREVHFAPRPSPPDIPSSSSSSSLKPTPKPHPRPRHRHHHHHTPTSTAIAIRSVAPSADRLPPNLSPPKFGHGNGSGLAAVATATTSDGGSSDVFYARRRSAMGMIAGIFTCWNKERVASAGAVVPRISAAALMEQAKAQQEALMESQDTSDMWEWLMEQQQAVAALEHELLERDQFSSPPPPPGGMAAESERLLRLFSASLLRCRWEINVFCRVYMQQIVRAGYSLINTLMEMEPSTVFIRRVHASYALEARISAALFRCFENDSFDDSGLTHIFDAEARSESRLQDFLRLRSVEPSDALRMHSAAYEPAFHAYAAAKSEEVLSLLPAAAMAFRSAAQHERFMEAFLRAAKWAFLLHRLATAFNPPAAILRVAKGHGVDPLYVEAVALPPIGSCPRCSATAAPAVEFMVWPGFVSHGHRKVFRCRVYQHFMCKR